MSAGRAAGVRPGVARYGDLDRTPARELRDPGPTRVRRDGRGLPGEGPEARPGRGGQGAARGILSRRGTRRALPARGPTSRRLESPEHRVDPRARGVRGSARPRARAGPRRDAGEADLPWSPPARRGAFDLRTGGRRAGGGAREGHRPPRPQAGKRGGHPGRTREAPGLRPGQGLHRGRHGRRSDNLVAHRLRCRHERGADPGDGFVHEPRASQGPGAGRADGHLVVRVLPLRGADGPAGVQG